MDKYEKLLTHTTLIPLWAKAVESSERDPILVDKHASHILKALGYDLTLYNRIKQNPSQVGCCLRAKWMDDEALRFVQAHQPCQVIQLGAGLDDRFRRTGTPAGVVHWYDLDLDEVITMRRLVIPEVERNEMISMDMFDVAWMEKLGAHQLPTLIIIEGVLMFMEEDKIKDLFGNISRHFAEATVLFDAVPRMAVGKARYHDAVKKYSKKVEYVWGIGQEEEVSQLSPRIHLLDFVRMSDLPKAGRFIWPLRWMYKIPFFYRKANQLLVKVKLEPPE